MSVSKGRRVALALGGGLRLLGGYRRHGGSENGIPGDWGQS